MFLRISILILTALLASCAAGPASVSADQLAFYQVVPQSYHGQVLPTTDRTGAPENQAYYFKSGGFALRAADISAINAQGKYLVQHPDIQVLLAGHTDARGSASFNLGLAWQRVEAVAKQLALMGVKPTQIQQASFGGMQPAVLGQSAKIAQLNNRVNLIYEVSNETSS